MKIFRGWTLDIDETFMPTKYPCKHYRKTKEEALQDAKSKVSKWWEGAEKNKELYGVTYVILK